MVNHIPTIEILSQKGMATFKLSGTWLAKATREAEPLCENILQMSLPIKLLFDFTGLEKFDTAGVWLLKRTMAALEQKGHQVSLKNASDSFLTLSTRLDPYQPTPIPEPQARSFVKERLIYIGKTSLSVLYLTRDLIVFLGQVTCGLVSVALSPRRIRFTAIVAHIETFGLNAVPIVSVIAIALGLVLAYQGEEQLRRFGAEIYTINLVSISVVREVGILITAILVAGRTGSAITAQLGIMKINQEVDALHTLGLSPMEVLIIPRLLALIIVMPCLAFIADLAGLLGGGIMVVLSLDVSPLFGAILGIVSCFEGMRVKGTAESVGICTTRSVVEGIFLVTLADAFLSIFFSKVGI
jgi:phospholipid/cholesterol/gamma-HCH transport system permease protein